MALHRLDLPLPIANRPAWDLAVIGLIALALPAALTGLAMGARRLGASRGRRMRAG